MVLSAAVWESRGYGCRGATLPLHFGALAFIGLCASVGATGVVVVVPLFEKVVKGG